jgi:hypothetical protein
MSKNFYISGEFNVICDRCGQKHKAHNVLQEWTGFIVCKPCYEHRHPQDFVKAHSDKITVPFTRPRPIDLFVDDGNRTITEFLPFNDPIAITFSTAFSDRLNIDDSGQDYIDPTYFAEDYIGTITILLQTQKPVFDTVPVAEVGYALRNQYIDIPYFADQYVGEYQQF